MALSFLFAELLGRLYVSVCAVWECGRECPAPQRAAGHASRVAVVCARVRDFGYVSSTGAARTGSGGVWLSVLRSYIEVVVIRGKPPHIHTRTAHESLVCHVVTSQSPHTRSAAQVGHTLSHTLLHITLSHITHSRTHAHTRTRHSLSHIHVHVLRSPTHFTSSCVHQCAGALRFSKATAAAAAPTIAVVPIGASSAFIGKTPITPSSSTDRSSSELAPSAA